SRRLGAHRVAQWLAYPFAYVLYSLGRGARTGWYPYPFLAPSAGGDYTSVVVHCLAIAIVVGLLGGLGRWVGNRRGGSGRRVTRRLVVAEDRVVRTADLRPPSLRLRDPRRDLAHEIRRRRDPVQLGAHALQHAGLERVLGRAHGAHFEVLAHDGRLDLG